MKAYSLPEFSGVGRLGRHVGHDPRSLRYPFKAASLTLTSHRWSTDATPVLDQGSVGSCTGNATVGALLCTPLTQALSTAQIATLNEDLAVAIYSRATQLDSYTGTYPPTDTGSDGLSVAKAAKEKGYVAGYTHAFSLDDALAALTTGPILAGISWYSGFDYPSSAGGIEISGSVRGGHEICFDEIDVENKRVWFRNSWSASWGIRGRANMSFSTFGSLLADDGDATVLTPLTLPAPTPIPVDKDAADAALIAATTDWVAHKKLSSTNEKVRQALLAWRKSRSA